MKRKDFSMTHAGCGGTVRIDDTKRRGWLRYEAFCARCLDCDPNGYHTVAEAIREATKFFGPKKASLK